VNPHPEHQQDHADLGKLGSEFAVGHEAGRKRPDSDSGQQVADQRGKL